MITYHEPAQLYLGRDWASAHAQGPRAFRTSAQAIRFALEEAAPVSLHGALLIAGGSTFSAGAIRALYRRRDYPLRRKRPSRLPPLNRGGRHGAI